jgi:hypothetical protein
MGRPDRGVSLRSTTTLLTRDRLTAGLMIRIPSFALRSAACADILLTGHAVLGLPTTNADGAGGTTHLSKKLTTKNSQLTPFFENSFNKKQPKYLETAILMLIFAKMATSISSITKLFFCDEQISLFHLRNSRHARIWL